MKRLHIRFKINRFSIEQKQFTRILAICCIFFIPFILTLQRPLTSTDTTGYFDYYQKAVTGVQTVESSYYLLSRLAGLLLPGDLGFRLLLFFYQTIAFSILLILIKRSQKPHLVFFIYFCFAYIYQFSIQIRSCVANLIFILAIYDIFERKWKSYYLKMLIAYFFHRSSILFFLVYPLCVFVLNHRKLLYFLPFFFVLIAKLFNPRMEEFIDFAEGANLPALKTIWTYTQLSAYQDSKVNPFNKISLFLFVIYYYPLIKYKVRNLLKQECICLTVISLSFFCYLFGAYNIPIIAQRYPEVFNLVLMIYLPLFIKRVREKQLVYILLWMYLLLIAENYSTANTMLSFIGIK